MAAVTLEIDSTSSADMGLEFSSIERDILPSIEPQIETIPGVPGGLFQTRKVGPRTITLQARLRGTGDSDIHDKIRDLAAWLPIDEPKAVEFSDDPDKLIYCVLSGETRLAEFMYRRDVTLTFIAPHPWYMDAAETPTALAVGANTVDNPGTATTMQARAVLLFDTAANFVKVSCGSRYMLIGKAASVADTPVAPWTTTLDVDGSSLAGWDAGWKCEGGTVAGSAATDGNTISPKHAGGSIGTGETWHGFSLRRSLSVASDDFVMDFFVGMDNRTPANSIAQIQAYGLDASANTLCLLQYSDMWSDLVQAKAYIRAGDATGTNKELVNSWGPKHGDYDNRYMHLSIFRIAGQWYGFACPLDNDGNWISSLGQSPTQLWVDSTISAQISQVEIRIAGYHDFALTNSCYIKRLRVRQHNDVAEDAVKNIAMAGDTIEIDCANHRVLVNGADDLSDVELGSDFPELAPGSNTLTIDTDGTLNAASSVLVRGEYM